MRRKNERKNCLPEEKKNLKRKGRRCEEERWRDEKNEAVAFESVLKQEEVYDRQV